MTGGDAPALLASFAPARRRRPPTAGDAVACTDLLGRRGSRSPSRCSRRPRASRRRTLVATGGLLGAEPVRAALEAAVAAAGAALTPAAGGALDGALHLATVLAETGTIPRHPAYVHLVLSVRGARASDSEVSPVRVVCTAAVRRSSAQRRVCTAAVRRSSAQR